MTTTSELISWIQKCRNQLDAIQRAAGSMSASDARTVASSIGVAYHHIDKAGANARAAVPASAPQRKQNTEGYARAHRDLAHRLMTEHPACKGDWAAACIEAARRLEG